MAENIRNDTVTVDTSNIKICDDLPNAERTVLILTNTSTNGQIISLAFGQEATSGAGIVLSPGGHHSESKDAGYRVTTKALNAISSGAGGTLAVHERILVNSYGRYD